MIEILQIIIQLFIFNTLFLFPITPYFASKLLKNFNINYFSIVAFNIIIQLFIYLIISFYNLNLTNIYFCFLLFSLIFLVINFKYNFQFFLNNCNKLLLSFLIINLSLFFVICSNPALGWDGVVHWINKAQMYFQGLGFMKTGIKEYPHLPGFIWGYFWKNSIIQKEYIGRLFLIFFYLTSIFYATNLFNNYIKDNLRIIFCFIVVFLSYDQSLFGGYNDYFIFSLFILSSIFLYNVILNVDKKSYSLYLLLFYISSFLLPWTKQEGFFWFILLILVLVFIQDSLEKKLLHLFNLSLLVGVFFSAKFFLHESISFAYQSLNLKILIPLVTSIEILRVFIDISYYIMVSFLKYPIWILILITFLIIGFDKNNKKLYRHFYLFLFFNIIFLYALMFHAYLVKSSLNEISTFYLILRVSLDRIVLQSSGFYLVLMILVLNRKIFKKKLESFN
jgi:hypothetical protein